MVRHAASSRHVCDLVRTALDCQLEIAGTDDMSVVAVELLSEAFLHNLPAVTDGRIGFEVLQTLVQDFAVPIGNGNRLRSGRYSVPQRLQVVDLLVDRQVIETGRRK